MPHPQLRITHDDRDQVVEHVKVAYAEGRLDKDEMDERLDLAMTARTHADLEPILSDLYGARAPYISPKATTPSRWHDQVGPCSGGDRVAAGFAHLLPLAGLFFVGPLIMLATAGRTSPYVRRHAIEALNFHLTVLGATVLLPFTLIGVILIPFIWVAAVVLSVVGGASALADGEFKYPLTLRLIK